VDNNANNDIAFESHIGLPVIYLHLLVLIRSLGPKLCARITYVWNICAS